MQVFGKLGSLLDDIDTNTEGLPSSSPSLEGRLSGLLSSAAAAAGSAADVAAKARAGVAGTFSELLSDEGGGGSLEAKIASWDVFAGGAAMSQGSNDVNASSTEPSNSLGAGASQEIHMPASQVTTSAPQKDLPTSRGNVVTASTAEVIEDDFFASWDLGGDSSTTKQLQAATTADVLFAASTPASSSSSSSKPKDFAHVDPQSKDKQKDLFAHSQTSQTSYKSPVQTQQTPELQEQPQKSQQLISDREVDSLHQQCRDLEQVLSMKDDELETLREQLANSGQKHLQEMEVVKATLEAKAEEEHVALNASKSQLEDQVAQLLQQVQEAQAQVHQKASEAASSAEREQEARRQIQELEEERSKLAELSKLKQGLAEEKDEEKKSESMQESDNAEAEDDMEQSKVEALEAEVQSLRSQLRPQTELSDLHAPRRSRRQSMVLDQIRKRDRVLVDLVHHQLHLNSGIGFKPVSHGDNPESEFKDEPAAMEVLKDVAEVLKIYNKATVLVEGHTATPAEKMDDWAFERANNRASFIKSKLESLGIDPHRVTTAGLPGYLGCGEPSIKFKILSYGEQPDEPSLVDKAAIAARSLKLLHNAEIEDMEAEYSRQLNEERTASQKEAEQLKSEIEKLTKEVANHEVYKDTLEEQTRKTEALEQQVEALQTALAEEQKAKESMHDSSCTVSEDDIELSKVQALEAEIESLRSQLRPNSELRAPRRGRRQTMMLAEIRKRDRVLVDLVHHQLHLNSEIGFKAVLRSETPYTEFEDEQSAMEVLKDVAEVMNIYEKATVLVEGHTATPPDKMDDWAGDLASSRADFIKSKLKSLGIDPHRVTTIGLPGYRGCGNPAIKFKILSYGEQTDEPSIFDKAAIASESLKSLHNAEIQDIEAEYSRQIHEERTASQKEVDELKSEIERMQKEIKDHEVCRETLEEHTKKTEALEQQVEALQTEAKQSKELHNAEIERVQEEAMRNLQEQCETSKKDILQEYAAQAEEHATHATEHAMEMQELGKQLEVLKSEASAATEMLATERNLRTAESEKMSQLTAHVEELQKAAERAKVEETNLRAEIEELQRCASEAQVKALDIERQSQDEQATATSEVSRLRQEVENLQQQLAETDGAVKQCEELQSKVRVVEQESCESTQNLTREINELKASAAAEVDRLKEDCARQVEEAHAAAKSEILCLKEETNTLQERASNAESQIEAKTTEIERMSEDHAAKLQMELSTLQATAAEEIQQLKTECARQIEEQHAATAEKLQSKAAEAESLAQKLEEMQMEAKELQASRDEHIQALNAKLDGLHATAAETEQEKDEHIRKLQEGQATAQSELERLRAEAELLSSQLAEMHTIRKDLEQCHEVSKEELNNEISRLQKAGIAEAEQRSILADMHTEAQTSIRGLNEQIENLQQQASAVETLTLRVKELEAQSDEMERREADTTRKLNDEISQLQQTHSEEQENTKAECSRRLHEEREKVEAHSRRLAEEIEQLRQQAEEADESKQRLQGAHTKIQDLELMLENRTSELNEEIRQLKTSTAEDAQQLKLACESQMQEERTTVQSEMLRLAQELQARAAEADAHAQRADQAEARARELQQYKADGLSEHEVKIQQLQSASETQAQQAAEAIAAKDLEVGQLQEAKSQEAQRAKDADSRLQESQEELRRQEEIIASLRQDRSTALRETAEVRGLLRDLRHTFAEEKQQFVERERSLLATVSRTATAGTQDDETVSENAGTGDACDSEMMEKIEAKAVELREKDEKLQQLNAQVADLEERAAKKDRQCEQLVSERNALAAELRAATATATVSPKVAMTAGEKSPVTIDIEANPGKTLPLKPASSNGCCAQADRPLHTMARRLAASALWRRIFFCYVAVLQIWVFVLLQHT